jgi:hypothetical protein
MGFSIECQYQDGLRPPEWVEAEEQRAEGPTSRVHWPPRAARCGQQWEAPLSQKFSFS